MPVSISKINLVQQFETFVGFSGKSHKIQRLTPLKFKAMFSKFYQEDNGLKPKVKKNREVFLFREWREVCSVHSNCDFLLVLWISLVCYLYS